METYFQLDNNAILGKYYYHLKERMLYQLNKIQENETNINTQSYDDKIMLLLEPELIAGENGMELKFEKSFEELCVYMTQQGYKNPKDLSTMEFYTAYYLIQKQNKNGKSNNRS